MTAYSMTVTNSLRAFGGGPPSLWNAYNWNAFKWAEGTVTIPFSFTHQVTNTLSPTSARYFNLTKLMQAEAITFDSAVNYFFSKLISNSLSFSSDMAHEYLYDGAGYSRLFPGGVADAEQRAAPTWSGGSTTSPTWTQGTASSTTWSAA